MSDIKTLIGFHADSSKIHEFFGEFQTLQCFCTNPTSYNIPSVENIKQFLPNDSAHRTILHGPYFTNFVKPNENTLKYTLELIKGFHENSIRIGQNITLVLHIGKPTEDYDADFKLFEKMLSRIVNPLSKNPFLQIALETDAGSKKGCKSTDFDALIKHLESIYDQFPFIKANKTISICLDTQHTIASGIDLSVLDYKDAIERFVSVVHLNSVPEKATIGKHLDRHSHTSFEECSHDPSYIGKIARICLQNNIPMILERLDMDIIKKDRDYLINSISSESHV